MSATLGLILKAELETTFTVIVAVLVHPFNTDVTV
jgi:hypothetical protein